MIPYGKRENPFFSNGGSSGILATRRVGPRRRTSAMAFLGAFCFTLSELSVAVVALLVFFVSIFSFLGEFIWEFFILREREREIEHGVGWVRR